MCQKRSNKPIVKKKNRLKLPKSQGFFRGFLCRDLYAEEIRLKVQGETEVPSTHGRVLSFLVRIIALAYFIDRMLAWQSFEKFKMSSYLTKTNIISGEYSVQDLNFEAQEFDLLIGFDKIVPPELGHFDFNLLTYGGDGKLMDLQEIQSMDCPRDHKGVKYAVRELRSAYDLEFSMKCIKTPDLIGTTGNKHSEYKYQTVSVSFARCSPTPSQECLPIDRSRNYSWFHSASLLVFSSQQELMLYEMPQQEDPTMGELTRDTFLHSGYKKQMEIKLDVGLFTRSTMQLRLNEVQLFDDPMFPSLRETTQATFLEVEHIETRKRKTLGGDQGEPMFELSLELAPLKVVHQRTATSFLFLCAVVAGGAIFLYWVMNVFYSAFSLTQGSMLAQSLLWNLYQVRKTKSITLQGRRNQLGVMATHQSMSQHTIDQMVGGNRSQYTMENSSQDLQALEAEPRASGDKSEDIIDELVTRERYGYKVDSVCSHFFQWCLKSVDQHVQRIKINGERRLEQETDLTWIIKQLRSQKMIYNSLMNQRDKILLRFNDWNVIGSDSELMPELGPSDSDLLEDYKKTALTKNLPLRKVLEFKLRKQRRRKCALLKQMDEKLALGVGNYRHGEQYEHDVIELRDFGHVYASGYSVGGARSTYNSQGQQSNQIAGSGRQPKVAEIHAPRQSFSHETQQISPRSNDKPGAQYAQEEADPGQSSLSFSSKDLSSHVGESGRNSSQQKLQRLAGQESQASRSASSQSISGKSTPNASGRRAINDVESEQADPQRRGSIFPEISQRNQSGNVARFIKAQENDLQISDSDSSSAASEQIRSRKKVNK